MSKDSTARRIKAAISVLALATLGACGGGGSGSGGAAPPPPPPPPTGSSNWDQMIWDQGSWA